VQTLLGAPRGALDPARVSEALSLARGAQVRNGVDVLVGGEVRGPLRFTDGEVTWSYRAPDSTAGQSDSPAAVRRQASLTVPAQQGVNLLGAQLRVWTDLRLRPARAGVTSSTTTISTPTTSTPITTDVASVASDWARFYLGVFIVTNPGALSDDGLRVTRTLALADKSYLWNTATLTEPLVVASGTKPVTYVRDRLAERGETAFALSGADTPLTAGRTFEAGTSLLDVWSRLLEADGNEQLTADELGRPASQPLSVIASRGPEVTYGARQGKVLTAGQVEPLLPSLPNVVRFSARQGPSLGNVEGNGLRTVRNQSTGPASIAARGYEVELRVDVEADTQAALNVIAQAEAQRYFAGGGLRWTGQVGLNPRHSDRDVIGLDLPRLEQSGGAWLVTSWTYPLGPLTDTGGALMPVTAERRVVL
jgi:hypothetical protein